jgi:hypothetical protein
LRCRPNTVRDRRELLVVRGEVNIDGIAQTLMWRDVRRAVLLVDRDHR